MKSSFHVICRLLYEREGERVNVEGKGMVRGEGKGMVRGEGKGMSWGMGKEMGEGKRDGGTEE